MDNTSVLVTSVSKTKTLSSNQSSFLPLTVNNECGFLFCFWLVFSLRLIIEKKQLLLVEYQQIIYEEN
jgi:hypothetical protein